MSYQYTFSVFTPTYNRAYCLHRAWEGLKSQTYRDFEWVIIDDGSADNTKELVNAWKKEADFPVTYVWQPNQGKHIAFNTASPLFKGKLYVGLDSDDTVKPHWLERCKFHWDKFTEDDKRKVAGMIYLAENQYGKLIGDKFPDDNMDVDFYAYTIKHKIVGDKGFFIQMDIFKSFPFPSDVKNVYLPEGYFFHALSQKWKLRTCNEILIVPFIEDRTDHTTLELRKPKNYAGNCYGHLAFLKFGTRLFWVKPYTFLANAVFYSKLSFLLKYSLKKQYTDIGNFWGRFFWITTFPLGYILAKREKN